MAGGVKGGWRNRIVGHGEEAPDQLLANALNWRINPKAQQEAAFKFAKWATSVERAAQWCVDTGYVAVRPDAFETATLKKYWDSCSL